MTTNGRRKTKNDAEDASSSSIIPNNLKAPASVESITKNAARGQQDMNTYRTCIKSNNNNADVLDPETENAAEGQQPHNESGKSFHAVPMQDPNSDLSDTPSPTTETENAARGQQGQGSQIGQYSHQEQFNPPKEKTATQKQSGGENMVKSVAEDQSSSADSELPIAVSPEASLSAEDLLKASKRATKTTASQDLQSEEQQPEKFITTTTTDLVVQATGEAAQGLVQASQQAEQAQFEIGAREALRDAQRIRQGYQLTLLTELTNNKLEDTLELVEQLNNLRSHTDATSSEAIAKTIEKIKGESISAIAPLDLRQKNGKLKII